MSWWRYNRTREAKACYQMAGVFFVLAAVNAVLGWIDSGDDRGSAWWMVAALNFVAAVFLLWRATRHSQART